MNSCECILLSLSLAFSCTCLHLLLQLQLLLLLSDLNCCNFIYLFGLLMVRERERERMQDEWKEKKYINQCMRLVSRTSHSLFLIFTGAEVTTSSVNWITNIQMHVYLILCSIFLSFFRFFAYSNYLQFTDTIIVYLFSPIIYSSWSAEWVFTFSAFSWSIWLSFNGDVNNSCDSARVYKSAG